VDRAVTHGGEGQSVLVHAVASDSCAVVDSAPGLTRGSSYLRGDYSRAEVARAAMPAESQIAPGDVSQGEFHFVMAQPIPSYLIALAVGDLAFQPIGPRTGVWAEPSVVKGAMPRGETFG
jgi:hypothetical protein